MLMLDVVNYGVLMDCFELSLDLSCDGYFWQWFSG